VGDLYGLRGFWGSARIREPTPARQLPGRADQPPRAWGGPIHAAKLGPAPGGAPQHGGAVPVEPPAGFGSAERLAVSPDPGPSDVYPLQTRKNPIFQNNAWTRTVPNMAVFDDVFVDRNVYSGLAGGAEHRQNLHELILGAQAVALSQQQEEAIRRIEGHNSELRAKGAVIPAEARGGLSVEDFCVLPARADIDDAIQEAERRLEAARQQDPIRQAAVFDRLLLPALEIAPVEQLLGEDLPALDAAAAARVQAHVAALGPGGERWIDDGMRRIPQPAPGAASPPCPFCAQELGGSPVIQHYRAYFSVGYAALKDRIAARLADIDRIHGGQSQVAFERAVRVAGERAQFWSRFCAVRVVAVDTAQLVGDWVAARDAVTEAVRAKQAAPLERMTLPAAARDAVTAYEARRQALATLDEALRQANGRIAVVKEQAAVANPAAIASDLSRLGAVKARHTPDMVARCEDYLTERIAKAKAEEQRDQARAALEQYRTTVFPGYQTAVNLYLQRFVAGFRIDSITAANTRGGPACSYDVVINNTAVPIAGGDPAPGEPSFRNTLSAGDRNTLALAFFFASVDQDPRRADKVVVIDDPISSLDEHRALTTVQEMRRLSEGVHQVIVLSHNKPFLCSLWEGSDTGRAALEVCRAGTGSSLRPWDVRQDCITEHDRRHAMLREYLVTAAPNSREVARAIRPVLEAFVRVAYPEHFPPGSLLGPFRGRCQQRIGTPQEILNAADTAELRDVLEYANRFHHDTNPAWETVGVNDAELRGFVARGLAFTKR
jgi:hypothetical protein